MAGIEYPKFGYPRVIPGPKPNFGYGLGLCLNSVGIFGLGTHKVQNFGVFWVLPLGTRDDWVPKVRAPKGNTQTVL